MFLSNISPPCQAVSQLYVKWNVFYLKVKLFQILTIMRTSESQFRISRNSVYKFVWNMIFYVLLHPSKLYRDYGDYTGYSLQDWDITSTRTPKTKYFSEMKNVFFIYWYDENWCLSHRGFILFCLIFVIIKIYLNGCRILIPWHNPR